MRHFHPPAGRFDGLIGGSPCQDFSPLNRAPGNNSQEMLDQYCRVVTAAQPDWFLHENVSRVPEFEIPGYTQQRFTLDLAWFSEYSRLRVFTFGSKNGRLLNPMQGKKGVVIGTAVTGNDERSFSACCQIQGLDRNFDLPDLTLTAKKQVVANGVPRELGDYIAGLICEQYYGTEAKVVALNEDIRRCGCGRQVLGRQKTSSATCRKRLSRRVKSA
ncbi:DNA cytosine methyltransferase [Psychromonas aquimarina]|uniref:DNA cytosine methyltransferase n=1 Tax=Psychromonas aquimarina TaxID=444919 RepID=UPI0009FCC1F3|nr:DNA cytosine methyltransferase [Psychromonas aquimarina]